MKVFTMKYCINCKHFSSREDDDEHQYARCSYNQPPSLVTGTLIRSSMIYCTVARIDGAGKCGVDGNHYEEKEVSHV